MAGRLERLRARARAVRRDAVAVWLAARDPRTPRPARLLALAVAAYALSPIDLIPDFIPVLGWLDELILLPAAILLITRTVPEAQMAEHRAAAARINERPVSRWGAAAVVALWAGVAAAAGWWWLG